MKDLVKKKRGCSVGGAGDLRGTAYVTEAAKPFKGNGVSSTAVVGGDLRTRGGEKSGVAK